MSRLKRAILIICALLPLSLAPAMAYASDSQLFSACTRLAQENSGNKNFKPSPICADQGTATDPVNHILHVAANIVALLTGLAAVILIIISGISMITSAGKAESVANARKRIIGALVGLAIVALAWTIVTFLTNILIT